MFLHDQKGFSIIELLVVIAIIGIIVGFSVPSFGAWKADRELDAEIDDLVLSIRRMQQLSLQKSKTDATSRVSMIIQPGGYQIITDSTSNPQATQPFTSFHPGISIFPSDASLTFDPYTLSNNMPAILTLRHTETTNVRSIVIARETGRIRIDSSTNPDYRTGEE
jgi:prepilin-type N-terminal cleavage/methylation domain-containing protein